MCDSCVIHYNFDLGPSQIALVMCLGLMDCSDDFYLERLQEKISWFPVLLK